MRSLCFFVLVAVLSTSLGAAINSSLIGYKLPSAEAIEDWKPDARIVLAWSVTREQREFRLLEGNLSSAQLMIGEHKSASVAFVQLRSMKGSISAFLSGSKDLAVRIPVSQEPLSSGRPSLHEIPIRTEGHGPFPLIVAIDLPAEAILKAFMTDSAISSVRGIFEESIWLPDGSRSSDPLRLEATFTLRRAGHSVTLEMPTEESSIDFGPIDLGEDQAKPNQAPDPTSGLRPAAGHL